MLSLEQVKLLESKIIRAIDFVNQITGENVRLKKQNEELKEAAARLRDEKTKVEEGFASAMGRLSQFEDAIERSLSAIKEIKPAQTVQAQAVPAAGPLQAAAQSTPAVPQTSGPPEKPAESPSVNPGFEQPAAPQLQPSIPSAYTVDEDEESPDPEEEEENSGEAELDIF